MNCHTIAFVGGFLLDLLLGDPYFLPHPVRLIGKLITIAEKKLHGKQPEEKQKEIRQGAVMAAVVLAVVVIVTGILLWTAYSLHSWAGIILECLMTYQILAVKCLKVESMKVYRCLKEGNLIRARKAVSMIVGRDTDCLDEEGVAKAAVETVAENTSDGVIAPMLCLALGGPVLGFAYKAVNTMDSMVGYKTEEYLYFGRAAAKLDDAVNFIPSRFSAFLMIVAAFLSGSNFSGKNAVRIYQRDCRNHASPNSAQTESVCAGALGIRLAGDAVYFGKVVRKPYIGDELCKVEYEDIERVNRLMYMTAWLCEILCILLLLIC